MKYLKIISYFGLIMFLFLNISVAKDLDVFYNKRGLYYLGLKKYNEAELYFKKAVLINKKNKYYYNNLAISQLKNQKYKEACLNLLEAIKLDDKYVKAYANLAIACFYLNDFKTAYNYYNKAVELDNAYIEKRFDRNKAKKELKKLREENPQNTEYIKLEYYINRN